MDSFERSKVTLAGCTAGLWLTLFCLGNNALAQDRSPAVQTRSQTDSAAIDGNRITIDVTVSDPLGHPVEGLQAGNFTVLDNRDPQKLIGFRALDAESSSGDPAHIVVIVDMINTGFTQVAWERQQLETFLKQDGGKLSHPTSIAIFADKGVKAQRVSSLDGGVLLTAFDKLQTELRSIRDDAGFYGAAERLETSLNQLSQLVSYEATLPGRKLFLVISPGWPLLPTAGDQEDMKQRVWVFNSLVELTNNLRATRTTLYCLEPRELGATNPFLYQGYLKPVALSKNAGYPNLALQVLAEHSGGQVLINGKDIAGDLNSAVRDASGGYELTFAAVPGDRPNEYHALQVQVDKTDVKVRTTAGYYARPQVEGGH
jgi:VWFA-related protein